MRKNNHLKNCLRSNRDIWKKNLILLLFFIRQTTIQNLMIKIIQLKSSTSINLPTIYVFRLHEQNLNYLNFPFFKELQSAEMVLS